MAAVEGAHQELVAPRTAVDDASAQRRGSVDVTDRLLSE